MKASYLTTAVTGAVMSITTLASSASGQPNNVVYQFQVLTESLRYCPNDSVFDPPTNDCTVTPGHAPYMLMMVTLTHQAFAKKHAIWASGTVAPGDPTDEKPADDQGIVSLVTDSYPWPMPQPNNNGGLYDLRLPPPPNSNVSFPLYFEADLNIVGGEIGGQIEMTFVQIHGDGCELSMTGRDGHWSGAWACFIFGYGVDHAFTAIATREIGKVAQR